MILINILAIVAVAAGAVMLLIGAQDPAIERATALRDAGQALAIARGGELSALVALRRDALEAPAADHAGEAWAAVAQTDTAIPGGRFSLTIDDAQARFNVNAAGAGGEPQLAAITTALGLPADVASRISGSISERGPVRSLNDLGRAGIDAPTIAALRPLVTALPGKADVNVNAAGVDLLGALLGDRVVARLLVDRRARAGRLTPADFAATSASLPQGMGFTSNHYVVTTTVTIGGVTQALTSLLERRRGENAVAVVAIARARRAAGM